MNSEPERFKALVKASLIAITADLFLIGLKYLLAKITGSAVLFADAWHSGGDFAVSFTVLLSLILNKKFNHNVWARNAEALAALLIAAILLFGSINVIIGAIQSEVRSFLLKPGIPLVFAILGISAACCVSFEMFRFKRRMGEKFKSIAFKAESDHTRADYFTSFGVLLTLILAYFSVHLERMMTLIVGIMVLRIGLKLLLKALKFLNISAESALTRAKKILPEKIEILVLRVTNRIVDIYNQSKTVIGQLFFIREEWIIHRKKLISVSILVLCTLLYLGTGFYSNLPYQTGIELLFGKVISQTEPGAHYNLPAPFGKIIKVDTDVIARLESGYRTLPNFKGSEPSAYLWEFTHNQGKFIKVPDEAAAITGDENIVDVNMICFYKINDPVIYALNNVDAHELLRNIFVHEIHIILGKCQIDSLLTTGRQNIQDNLLIAMRKRVEEIPLGVEIIKVLMQEAHPPLEVVPAYRAVASARERKDQIIHQAGAYRQDLLPRSRGKAIADVLASEAYSVERISGAQGEAESFLLKQSWFGKFESVQKQRLKWETVENAMQNKTIWVLPADAKKRILTPDDKIRKDKDE